MCTTFKDGYEFKKRVELCNRIKDQHPDRIAVIIEIMPGSKLVMSRKKFLVPKEISMASFVYEVRKHTSNLSPEEALFLLCGSGSNTGTMVPTSQIVEQVYEKFKDDDGFLYITVVLENTFGMFFTAEQVALKMLDDVLDEVLDVSGRIVKLLNVDF